MFLDLPIKSLAQTTEGAGYPPAEEIAHNVASPLPGCDVTVAIVKGAVISFSQSEPAQLNMEALLGHIKQIAPGDLEENGIVIRAGGSDLTPEQKKELHLSYPQLAFEDPEETTLDLSHVGTTHAKSPLGFKHVALKAKHLPHLQVIDLTGFQNKFCPFSLLALEKKRGIRVKCEPPKKLVVPRSIETEGEPHAPTLQEIEAVLRRFYKEPADVDLCQLATLTTFDILYLEMLFPEMRFSVAEPVTCTLPLFDRSIVERVCNRFPSIELRLNRTTLEDERELLKLLNSFSTVRFPFQARLNHLLEDPELLKGHLHRTLDTWLTNTLSDAELTLLADRSPSLSPLVVKILAHRKKDLASRLAFSLRKEIDLLSIDAAHTSTPQPLTKPSPSLEALLERYGSEDSKSVLRDATFHPLAEPASSIESPLLNAITNRSEEKLKLLLAEGADVNSPDDHGRTPLHIAAELGYENAIELLIAKGAKIDALNRRWDEPIHLAARNGHEKVVELLIARGAKVDAVNKRGNQPIHLAAQMGRKKLVALLLANGAKVDALNGLGDQPLHVAAIMGREKTAELLIAKGAKIDAANYSGDQPIHLAAENGHLKVLDVLLAKGAEVGARNSVGDQPLHLAAERGHAKVAEFLLEKGAKIEAVNKNGDPPLHRAALMGNEKVVELLLEKGADVDSTGGLLGKTALRIALELLIAKKAGVDYFYARSEFRPLAALLGSEKTAELLRKTEENKRFLGRRLLHFGEAKDYEKVTELLLVNGAKIDAVNNCGDEPLSTAALWEHERVVGLLIAKGTRVDVENLLGNQPLHLACEKGYEKVAELLIAKGIKVDAIDTHGYQPIHLATRHGHEKLVELLIERGAKVDAKNGLGDQPIHLAAENGQLNVLDVLIDKGAEVGARNHVGDQPIHLAAQMGRERAVELLIEKGADINSLNCLGKPPLRIVLDLLGDEKKEDAMDFFFKRPLPYREPKEFTKVAELLIAKGAKVDL